MKFEENYTFPPIYKLILKNIIPSGKLKVLDLGCGKGVAGEVLNSKKIHEFTGIDIYKPYLKVCKKKSYYKKLIIADITKAKIQEKSFDVVLLLQVIEHLDKEMAKSLIKKAIGTAKKCIIVSVPNGYCHQEEYDENVYHKHLSTWVASDLRKLGFTVYGQGLRIIYGSESYGVDKGINWWQKIAVPLSIIIAPIIFFIPSLGAQLIAVKYIND